MKTWGVLVCPFCEGWNLRHETVQVFDRDEDSGLHVTVDDLEVHVDGEMAGNPHGLTIEFYCENCDKRPLVAIDQHKGHTDVRWVGVPG